MFGTLGSIIDVKFVILVILTIFGTESFLRTKKILVTFAIFAKSADF